ncbi:hypothetical protein N9J72_01175 [Candidatus Gracilibacteria bacterium]|nr:hypothetical protein [Candidatus Gracilibacteria bacterium]
MKYIYTLALLVFLASCSADADEVVQDTIYTETSISADVALSDAETVEIPVTNEVLTEIIEEVNSLDISEESANQEIIQETQVIEEPAEIEEIPAASVEPRAKRGGHSSGSSAY